MHRSGHRICAGIALLASSCVLPAAASNVHSAPLDVTHDKPFIMVMVNGKGPFRFVIDTGTGGEAFVTEELAEQLGLPVTGHARLSDPSGQGGQRAPIVLIQSLEVAGVRFSGVKAVEHPLSSDDGACQGLLGFVLFRDYLLTLDFPNRRVTLSNSELAPDGGKSVIPFRMPLGVPLAMLQLDGINGPVEAQLDSGGGGLVLPERIATHLKYDVTPILFASGQSVCTRFQIKMGKLGSDIRLGKYTFAHPVVEIHPAFPLINFGSPPMQMFAISFDQKNLLVRFVSDQKKLTLMAPPSPPHMTNEAVHQPPPDLVPVG